MWVKIRGAYDRYVRVQEREGKRRDSLVEFIDEKIVPQSCLISNIRRD
jgi:hypothetical protein